MIRFLILFALLILTACAPAYPLPQGGSGDILPAEAQRVIDQATATAGAVATRGAMATEAAQIAQATSTAGALATRDSLQVEQTRSALQITEQAAAAIIARDQAQQTQAQAATHAAATPTAEALRNQIRADQIAADQAEQARADWAAFWNALGDTIVFVVLIGGLSLTVAIIGAFALRAWAIFIAAQAQIAREAFKMLPPSHYADYDTRAGGYRVLPMPALNAPPDVIDIDPQASAGGWASGWKRAYRLYVFWGDRFGFGIRDLGPKGVGVVSDPDWRRLNDRLVAKGVLVVRMIDRGGKKVRVTTWADQMSLARFYDDYGNGRIALPLPADEEPPTVKGELPENAATQHSLALVATQPTQGRPPTVVG